MKRCQSLVVSAARNREMGAGTDSRLRQHTRGSALRDLSLPQLRAGRRALTASRRAGLADNAHPSPWDTWLHRFGERLLAMAERSRAKRVAQLRRMRGKRGRRT